MAKGGDVCVYICNCDPTEGHRMEVKANSVGTTVFRDADGERRSWGQLWRVWLYAPRKQNCT